MARSPPSSSTRAAEGRRSDRRRRGLGQGPSDDQRQGRADQGRRAVDAGRRCSACPACPTPATSSAPLPNEKIARTVGEAREQRAKVNNQRGDARVQRGVKLEDIFSQIQAGEVATLNLVLKADVHGSLEAVTESLRRLERDDVKLAFVHRAVGGITENDIMLAVDHERHAHRLQRAPERRAPATLAEHRGRRDPHLRDHLQAARGHRAGDGRHARPRVRRSGHRRSRGARDLPGAHDRRASPVATCARARSPAAPRCASSATASSSGRAAIRRCRRFKEDAREVREGFECGIGLSDFQDLKPGDLIETFEEREIPRT